MWELCRRIHQYCPQFDGISRIKSYTEIKWFLDNRFHKRLILHGLGVGGVLVQSAGRPGPKVDLPGHDLGAYKRWLYSCSWKPRTFLDLKLHTKSPPANNRYKCHAPVLLPGIVWVEEPRVQMPTARLAFTLRAILHLFPTIFRVQTDFSPHHFLELHPCFLTERGIPNIRHQPQIRKECP